MLYVINPKFETMKLLILLFLVIIVLGLVYHLVGIFLIIKKDLSKSEKLICGDCGKPLTYDPKFDIYFCTDKDCVMKRNQ